MHFTERPPSSGWEAIPFADDPNSRFWAWFKPAGMPLGIAVRIPPETFADYATRRPLTIRTLLTSLGADPRAVAMWSLYGVPNDAWQGTNPALDYPLPPAPPGLDPTISIYVHAAPAPVAPIAPAEMPPSAMVSPATGAGPAAIFERIEVAWSASLQLELQLAALAKQLNGGLMRLNATNRDLTSEENRFGDNQDKREWNDTRRLLRDGAHRIARVLKDHHIGMTSTAGKRNEFQSLYDTYVVPRKTFDGLQQTERDFDAYRKALHNLLNNMSGAQGAAVQDGERRAQQILTRIAAKVRAARTKRG